MAKQSSEERKIAIREILKARSIMTTGANGKLEESLDSNELVGALLSDTSGIYQYTMDHDPETERKMFADGRLGKSTSHSELSPKYISAKDINKFVLDNYEHVDYKKLIVFLYYSFDLETKRIEAEHAKSKTLLSSQQEDKKGDRIYKENEEKVYNEFKRLAEKYIPRNENIEIFGAIYLKQGDKICFNHISSQELIDGKNSQKNNIFKFVNPDDYTFSAAFIKKSDLPLMLKNPDAEYTVSQIFYPELIKEYKSESYTILKILNDKKFAECIDKDKFCAISEYRIINSLSESMKEVSYIEGGMFSEKYIERTINVLKNLENSIDPSFKIENLENGKEVNSTFLKMLRENITNEFINKYLSELPEKAYEFSKENILTRESILATLGKVKEPEKLLGIAYINGTFAADEVAQLCKDYAIDADLVKEEAFVRYLLKNDLTFKSNNFDKISISDDKIYSLLSNSEKDTLANYYISKIEESKQPSKNFKRLIDSGDITVQLLQEAFFEGRISEEKVKYISGILEDNKNLDKEDPKYNLENLKFNSAKLVEAYKTSHQELIKKALEDEGIEYTLEKSMKDQLDDYQYQMALFEKNNYLSSPIIQSEIMDNLDYLGLNSEVLKDLYENKIINVATLKDYGDDAGETPENRLSYKLYKEGLLRKEDERAVIDSTNEIDNPVTLIRLKDNGQISNNEIITKYMKGQISKDSMVKYAENTDIKSNLKRDALLNLFSKAARSSDKEALDNFQKYSELYNKFVNSSDSKLIEEETKIVKDYVNDNNVEVLYTKGLVHPQLLVGLSDLGIVNLLKNNGLINASDAKLIFRDSTNSHEKRDRLENIFKKYSLNNDEKMSILLSVYGNSNDQDSQEITEADKNNFNYFMDNGYIDIDTYQISSDGNESQGKRGQSSDSIAKTEQSIMPFLERSAYLNHLDAKSTVEIVSTTYVAHMHSFDKVLFEQICSKRKGTTTSDLTSHATYIVDENVYQANKKNIYQDNQTSKLIDWHVLTSLYKDNTPGIAKAIHRADRWQKSLATKLGTDSKIDEKEIQKKIVCKNGKEK